MYGLLLSFRKENTMDWREREDAERARGRLLHVCIGCNVCYPNRYYNKTMSNNDFLKLWEKWKKTLSQCEHAGKLAICACVRAVRGSGGSLQNDICVIILYLWYCVCGHIYGCSKVLSKVGTKSNVHCKPIPERPCIHTGIVFKQLIIMDKDHFERASTYGGGRRPKNVYKCNC